jgi:hypothetical protein
MIKKFFKYNVQLISIDLLVVLATFVVNILIAPILIQDYGYTAEIIASGNLFLGVGLFFGSFFTRYILQFKINYFRFFKRIIMIFFILQIIYVVHATFNKSIDTWWYETIYIVARLIEGTMAGSLIFLIDFLIGYKLINNKYRGTLQGSITSGRNAIKFLAPIIGGLLITATGYSLSMYVVSMLVYVSIYVYMDSRGKRMFRSYYKYMCRKFRPPKFRLKKIKLKEIFDLSYLVNLYQENKPQKRIYLIHCLSANALRPIYDLYIILAFTMVLGFSILEAAFLISMMVLSISMTILLSFFYDRLYSYVGKYKPRLQLVPFWLGQLVFIVIFYAMFKGIIQVPDEHRMLSYAALMFYLGIVRSFNQDYQHRSLFVFAGKEGQLANFKGALSMLTNVGLMIGYVLFSTVYYFYSFDGVFIAFSIMAILFVFYYFKVLIRGILNARTKKRDLPC